MCAALVLLVLLSAPTGWLYDLWVGEGTEQGQWPSVEVQRLRQQDGSWLCVYFDDYLAWTGADNYPTGYVRYTTTEERRILDQMAEDYDVNPVYVLDMYRHGKVSRMLDSGLRLVVLAVAGVLILTIMKLWKNKNNLRSL